MRKTFKKVCALALTLIMLIGMSSIALAYQGVALDETISVTGLQDGDSVKFYQVLKYDPTAETGWTPTENFAAIDVDDIVDGTISPDDAKAIVTAAFEASADYTVSASSGAAELEIADETMAGLYVAFVVPSANDKVTLYNPVFVSADFDADVEEGAVPSNVVDLTDATGTYNNGESKKQTPQIEKEMDDSTQCDVAVGDTVAFTITTTIPAYATYKNPVFTISDSCTTGLEIDTNSIVVEPDDAVFEIKNASATGFTIEFDTDYLLTLEQSVPVTVTYNAEVTAEATANVTEMVNDAKLKFSNHPLDETGKGEDEEKTYHYTFTIDGNINGSETLGEEEQYLNKELIKTAVDAEGNPVLDVVREYPTQGSSSTTTTEASPLIGCTFTLTDEDGEFAGSNADATTGEVTTDANGFIVFRGLDVGTYTLKETSAPAGYVMDPDEHTVVIAASYDTDGVLTSYTVTVDGKTSLFEVTNTKTGDIKTKWLEGDTDILPSLIQNVQAKELPSTGGIGTTIFYVVGSVLLVGAAVLLITKRRMRAM